MARNDQVKQRIEQKYESEDRVDEIGTDYAGQLTILFCERVDYASGLYPSL